MNQASELIATAPARRRRLGDVLREGNHISGAELERAIQQHQGGTGRLGEVLLERDLVSREVLASALEEASGFHYASCSNAMPELDILALVPRTVAERHCAFPLERRGRRLHVAMAEPQNLAALDELRFVAGMDIVSSLSFRDEIRAAIARNYSRLPAESSPSPDPLAGFDLASAPELEFITPSSRPARSPARDDDQAELRSDHTPAVRLVSALIMAAAARGASDIHIEHLPSSSEVRIRVDGRLQPLTQVPAAMRNSLISRIKILADLDIAERRVSQDGRFLVRLGAKALDVRVSTLPTQFGEKVVLRLLDSQGHGSRLEELGLSPQHSRAVREVLCMPQGMLLVTGPTGSGKSTTLYAALNLLRNASTNITTVEDPVEYMIAGVNQVQINPKAGRTFAAALRSILRQDPNVIMVGEIRDAETAEIALTAAQTGHLVLSTLHTNDAVAAVARLLDLGIPPFLISSSVTAIIGQRLVRKLCSCARPSTAEPEDFLSPISKALDSAPRSSRSPAGCERCAQTGFKGRVGIFETLLFDDQIRNAVSRGARDDEVRGLARLLGMKFMQDDALEKVQAGITTLEEATHVVPFDTKSSFHCSDCRAPLSPGFAFCPYCGSRAGGGSPPPEARRSRHLSKKGLALR